MTEKKIGTFLKKNEAEILSSKKKIKRTFCRKSSRPSLIHILSLSTCIRSTSFDASYFKSSFTCMQQFVFSPSFTSHRQRFFLKQTCVFLKLRALWNSMRFQILCAFKFRAFSNSVFFKRSIFLNEACFFSKTSVFSKPMRVYFEISVRHLVNHRKDLF